MTSAGPVGGGWDDEGAPPAIRRDRLHDVDVHAAPARSGRPSQYGGAHAHAPPRPAFDPGCPFCPGNERDTTKEVLARRGTGEADGPGWSLRVVTNRYPVLVPPDGMHEVVIETPRHDASAADHDEATLAAILLAYRDRVRALSRDGLPYVLVFRNQHAPAGASIVHPHTQITAQPRPALAIERTRAAAVRHFEATGGCLACHLLARDRAEGREVAREAGFVCVAPFASRFAYETWLAPAAHPRPFEAQEPAELEALARLLRRVLLRQREVIGDAAQNWVLSVEPPLDTPKGPVPCHWRLEILPRLARLGGFELGTGAFVNTVLPERAARELRPSDGPRTMEP